MKLLFIVAVLFSFCLKVVFSQDIDEDSKKETDICVIHNYKETLPYVDCAFLKLKKPEDGKNPHLIVAKSRTNTSRLPNEQDLRAFLLDHGYHLSIGCNGRSEKWVKGKAQAQAQAESSYNQNQIYMGERREGKINTATGISDDLNGLPSVNLNIPI